MRKFHFGAIEWFFLALVIMREYSVIADIIHHCGHYTSGVNVNNTWFLISDTRILRQQKLQCNSRDIPVANVLIYIKKVSGSSTKSIKLYRRS